MTTLPDKIHNEEQLMELLSRPSPHLIETMSSLKGDIIFLGVAGKMGPSMAQMAWRACREAGVDKRVIGVSRFRSQTERQRLESIGIETWQGDLLDRDFIETLPEVENVIFLTGMKFGAENNLPMTWAVNTYLPGMIAERYGNAKIVALSTGSIYPLVAPTSGGCRESQRPQPVGEYAQSCLGRERMFEYGSLTAGTPVTLIRLNYAVEMRYGVLVDIALKVKNDIPVDLTMGYFNVIWQGDANDHILRSLDLCSSPANILNVAGAEILTVRETAEEFATYFNKKVAFVGREAETALLSNASKSQKLFGKSRVNVEQMIAWIADWVANDRPLLGKPTHFEVRDGRY